MHIDKNLIKHIPKSKYASVLPDFKQKRTQAITTVILTLFAFSFFGLFAIKPTLGEISELNRKLSDSQFVHERLEGKISNLSLLSQKYNRLETDLPIIYSAIPQNPQAAILVGQLQALAQASNIIITSLQTSEVIVLSSSINEQKVPEPYIAYNFSLDAKGTYENIKSFVNNAGNFDRIVTINYISLSTSSKKNEQGMVVTIQGKVYFKK